MADHHAGDLPGRPAGPVSTCSVPGSPPPAGTPAPAPMSARRGHGGAAAGGTPATRRPWAAVDPRASQPRPPPHHPLPVRPDAGRRPRRPPTAAADPLRPAGAAVTEPPGVQRGADSATAPPRTPEPVRPDTWRPRTPGHRTPDTWMLDVRSTGWTDIPRRTGRADRATPGLAGVRTSSDRRHPLGGPTSSGSRRLGALGHPGRLRGDGTRAAALTTAATGQLPSTAWHQAAPRRTAVLRRFRVERRANGEASSVMTCLESDQCCR